MKKSILLLMVMAMEIYGRDRALGKECIELINYPSNVNSVIPRLNDKYGTSQYAPENDSYHQRYVTCMATCLRDQCSYGYRLRRHRWRSGYGLSQG